MFFLITKCKNLVDHFETSNTKHLSDDLLRASLSDFAWLEVLELLRHPFYLLDYMKAGRKAEGLRRNRPFGLRRRRAAG